MEAPPRLSARVLLIDARDRVLLLHTALPDGRSIWLPPGGGIESGETAEQAAVRDVREETGVVLDSAGSCVWSRRTQFFGLDQAELFFFARVPGTPEVMTAGNPVAAELATLLEHRWWACSEIAEERDALFVPRALSKQLEALLTGAIPIEPFDVGI